MVAASTLSAVPGQRVGEQAYCWRVDAGQRALKRLSATADAARFDRATRSALEPALHEDHPRCRRLHHARVNARAKCRHGVTRSEANPRAASQLRDLAPPARRLRALARHSSAASRGPRAGACTHSNAMSRFGWCWWWVVVVGGSSAKFSRHRLARIWGSIVSIPLGGSRGRRGTGRNERCVSK